MRTLTTRDARQAVLALLDRRGAGKTVCPSEVARNLVAGAGEGAAADWRDAMPLVHAAVDDLAGNGLIRLSWKGRMLDRRAGPYRIRASSPLADAAKAGELC